jgi:hypothetical protein
MVIWFFADKARQKKANKSAYSKNMATKSKTRVKNNNNKDKSSAIYISLATVTCY